MNRLESAQRRYRDLVPELRAQHFPVRELLVWLRDAVCPAVDEIITS